MIVIQLEEIPEIAVEILEDGHKAVGFPFRLSFELHALGDQIVVISPKTSRASS